MKHQILIIASIVAMFASCKKDETTAPETKTQASLSTLDITVFNKDSGTNGTQMNVTWKGGSLKNGIIKFGVLCTYSSSEYQYYLNFPADKTGKMNYNPSDTSLSAFAFYVNSSGTYYEYDALSGYIQVDNIDYTNNKATGSYNFNLKNTEGVFANKQISGTFNYTFTTK